MSAPGVLDLKGGEEEGPLVVAGAAPPRRLLPPLGAWLLLHVVFALRYAHLYYSENLATDPPDTLGGLEFPGKEEPGWGDFVYQAFVIGCACATADVNVTSREMRSVCLVQGVVAFLFNTIVLALTINIGAGFI